MGSPRPSAAPSCGSGARPIRGGAVDSRRVEPGNAFFALPGERTDGQRFLGEAVARGRGGAGAVVTRRLRRSWTALQRDATVSVVAGRRRRRMRCARPRRPGATASSRWSSASPGRWPRRPPRSRSPRRSRSAGRCCATRATRTTRSACRSPCCGCVPSTRSPCSRWACTCPATSPCWRAMARPRIGVVTAVRATHLSRAGIARRHRARQARARRGAAGVGHRGAQRRRPARRAHARAHAGARARLRVRRRRGRDRGGRRVAGRGGHALPAAAAGRRARRRSRCPRWAATASTTRSPPRPSASRPGSMPPTIARGLARGFRAPHRTQLLRAGDWRILDDSYNAAPDSMAAALELLAQPARTARGRPRARCWSWARVATTPIARSAAARPGSPTGWSWSGPVPRRSPRARCEAGMAAGRVDAGGGSRRGRGAPAGGAAARRHDPREGVARRGAGPGGRRAGGGDRGARAIMNGFETISRASCSRSPWW